MSLKIVELNETNTCKICDNALAKYSCPKCNIIYCSVVCYQATSHLQCSENFYKENVLEELGMDRRSAESQAKMTEILQRMHEQNRIPSPDSDANEDYDIDEQYSPFSFTLDDMNNMEEELDSDDTDSVMDIADRLAGVDLDDAEKVWENLTEDEQQEFLAFLKSDDVSKLIPSWEPWWRYHSDSKVEDTEKEDEYKSTCPQLCDIKEYSQLTTKEPADCVKYNLINILASYAFTVRYFNGEHADFAHEAVSCVVNLSVILRDAQNLEDFETAVKSLEMEIINSSWILSDAENLRMMHEDLDSILRGPKKSDKIYYVLSALSDLYRLIEKAMKEPEGKKSFSNKFPNDFYPDVELVKKKKLKTMLKRINYYLSYGKYKFLN